MGVRMVITATRGLHRARDFVTLGRGKLGRNKLGRNKLGLGNRKTALLMTTAACFLLLQPQAGRADEAQGRAAGGTTGARITTAQQLAQASKIYSFNIPAQPLPQALAALSSQTGLQALYTEDQAFSQTSVAVNGTYSVDDALAIMLGQSGLTYKYVGADSITLIAAPSPAAPAIGPAAAAPAADAIQLAPISVTGERVERSIMDTAASVDVLDSETLKSRPGIETARDVLNRTVNVTNTGTGNFAPAIRGIDGTGPAQGANAFFAGTRPRLNIQVDGRPQSFNEVIFGNVSMWDVDRVEIFRGAQSTIQGRNAIAGAMIIKTKDPTWDYEYGARMMGGNFETGEGALMVSGPIVDDQLAFRIAADYNQHDSFDDMAGYESLYANVGDPERFRSLTLRGKLLIEPKHLEGFSTLLTIEHQDYYGPQAEDVGRPFGDHKALYPNMPRFRPKTTAGIMENTYELDDNVTLQNTFSYTDIKVKRYAVPGDGNVDIDGDQIVEEPRIKFSAADDRLNGLFGLYYFNADQDEFIDLFGGGNFDDSTETMAAYGEVTMKILSDLDLTAGGRVEYEKRDRTGAAGPFILDYNASQTVFLPKIGLAYHATDEVTVGATAARGYNGGGAGFTFSPPFVSYEYDPEYVWTYEAYTRADLADGRLQLTGNIFYSDYKDMQVPFDFNSMSSIIVNVDKAHTYGAELGARWLPLDELELFANIGLLKTKVTKADGALDDNELARAPALTASFGGIYRHESGLEFGMDAQYSEAYYSSVDNSPRGKVDPYWTVNAQLGYTWKSLHGFAFVKNIFDSGEAVAIYPGATRAEDTASLQVPRSYGIGLELQF